MSLHRKPDGIVISCDTPHCLRAIDTARKSIPAASDYARQKGWAIGNDVDACPKHHV